MSYDRVIPRDLFNEAKLLKCLGRLSLLIHDGKAPRLTLEHENPDEGFPIDQNPTDGSIFCAALSLSLDGRETIDLYSPLNSRTPYPLRFAFGPDNEGAVFTDDGSFSPEFVELLASELPDEPTGDYDGFSIECGCCCARCKGRVTLEGYADADGNHYCPYCNDYVHTRGRCEARTREMVEARQAEIDAAHVDEE